MSYLLIFTLIAISLVTECTSQEQVDFTRPLSPVEYQRVIKQGFSTNYFKARLPAARKYQTRNIQDIYDRGFRNVRLRCRADLYSDVYNDDSFTHFLTKLTEVVDECIRVGVAPIISWVHHHAEAYAREVDRQNYLQWWTLVAQTLRDRNYHLSYNLFTELGVDVCKSEASELEINWQENCAGSLRRNKTKYHSWTRSAIQAIRSTGAKNRERILILGSPEKTSDGLDFIDFSYMDGYMMVEWHEYAAGPSYEMHRPRYWKGTFTDQETSRLRNGVRKAVDFTLDTGIPTYFGAWMPRDNKDGGLNQYKVDTFAQFFVGELREAGIPWSLNVLDDYYDTRTSRWKTEIQDLAGARLNMSAVLDTIVAGLRVV